MTTVASIAGTLGLDTSDYNRGLDSAIRATQRLQSTAQTMNRTLGNMGGTVKVDSREAEASITRVETKARGLHSVLSGIGMGVGFGLVTTGLNAVKGVIESTGGAVIGFNSRLEQSRIGFTTMLGSAEKADAFLRDMQAFAKATPFEFPDLVTASSRMLAMGFSADRVKPVLTAVGDAVSALGGGSEAVGRVTTALGQMQAKGKASAEEMMQLTEAGIPAWQMLADSIGVSVPEAMKLVEKGVVSADTTINAVVAGMNSRFGGMMAAQSRTGQGLISTLKDVALQTAGTVMAPVYQAAVSGMQKLADAVNKPEFEQGVQKVATGMERVVNAAVSFGGKVGPPVLGALIAIVAWVQANWPGMEAMLVGVWQTLAPVVMAAIAAVLPPIQQFAGLVAQHWGTIGPVVAAAVAAFAGLSAIVGIIGSVVGAFSALGAASAAVGGPLALVVAVLGGPLTIALGAVALAIGVLAVAWSQNWGDIQGKVSAVWGAIGPVLTGMVDRLKAFADLILPEFVAAWQNIQDKVGPIIEAVAGFVTDKFNGIKDFISSHGDEIKQIASAYWDYVKSTVDNVLSVISNIIQLALNVIQGDWNGAWQNIKNIAQAVWDQIKAMVQLAIRAIPPLISLGKDAIVAAAGAIWDAVKSAASAAWDAVKAAVDTVIKAIPGLLSAAKEGIVNAAGAIWDAVKSAAESAWNAVKSTVETKIGEVLALIKGLPAKAAEGLGDLSSVLLNAGKALIQGFINGIESMFDSVKSKLGSLTDKLPDWKGPESRDATILYAAGQVVIGGFVDGMASMFPVVASALESFTSAMAAAAFAGGQSVAGAFAAGMGGGGMGGGGADSEQVPGQPAGVTWAVLRHAQGLAAATAPGLLGTPSLYDLIQAASSSGMTGMQATNWALNQIFNGPGYRLGAIAGFRSGGLGPGFAAGGMAGMSGLYRVGEWGEELMFLPPGAAVMNHAASRRFLDGSFFDDMYRAPSVPGVSGVEPSALPIPVAAGGGWGGGRTETNVYNLVPDLAEIERYQRERRFSERNRDAARGRYR